MDDSQSRAFGKDPSGINPSDSPGETRKPDRLPEITLESERGAGGSDDASDSKVKLVENGRPAPPENQGVESSNTTPTNHHCPPLSPVDTLSTGGLDWLSLSFYGAFEDSYWKLVRDQFEHAKQNAIDENLFDARVDLPSGIRLQVEPTGVGKGTLHCKWMFKYQGLTFKIRDCQSSHVKDRQPPNIFVVVSSLPLMTYGESEIIKLIRLILDLLGYSVERMSPSRVDLCVDLVDVPMSMIENSVKNRCYVSRCRKYNKYFNDQLVETIQFGSKNSKIKARIYNKYVECKHNDVKSNLLRDLRWGKKPDPALGAIRVEFEIMRDHLRDQHSIITYHDLVTKRKSLGRWLTHNWLRLTDREPQPGHSDRVGPSAFWQKVIDAFDSWTGAEIEERSKRNIVGTDISSLISQISGCLSSAIAQKGIFPADFFELESCIMDLITPTYPKLIQAIYEKRIQIEAKFPFTSNGTLTAE
ncbi:Replication initiation factor [Gimesia maris]|uniref:replication initiation factor domain-containing protein n=1 Tax=Gimesia maris TaxID=122 RepID=UPI00118CEBDF|nr:replication initiation factor domain-containing protein [Gimesia maris]QDT79267.1 Replication initiation factor [Gimesia maris]